MNEIFSEIFSEIFKNIFPSLFCNPIDAKPTGAQTLTLNLSLPAGRYVRIDWGDGNTTEISGAVSSQDYTNDYAGAGIFPIKIYGEFRFLTRFEIKTVDIDGTIERIAALSGLTYFRCYGSNTISGDLANLPSGLTYFYCTGSNTISGDLANLPSGLTAFQCAGFNTISGDLANLPSGLTYFYCTGSNTVSGYTGKIWTTKPATFILVSTGAGGLSEAEVDQLLIDFDDDLGWAVGNVITLTGTNAPRSGASDAAVISLEAEGVNVTTN